MKLLPIAVKSGALAKLLNNHIVLDQVISSNTKTEDFPNGKVTIRPEGWKDEYKNVRLTYKCIKTYQDQSGTWDVIHKLHTDIRYQDKEWSVTPATASGRVDLQTHSNYLSTVQYLCEVIRSIGDNLTPPTFQQWKERFINA
jgi:hypothetical protein